MAAWKRPTVTMPRYMARFRCIGGDCEASCCTAGWSIAVDDKTCRRITSKAPDDLKRDFLAALKTRPGDVGQKQGKIVKAPAEPACGLLAADGGCRIQQVMGAEALPAVCYVYPREALRIDDDVAVFADLSCPEAVRLALFDPDALESEPAGFDPLTVNRCPTVKIETDGKAQRNVMEALRQFSEQTLQRRDLPFWQRVFVVGMVFGLLKSTGVERPDAKALEVLRTVSERFENGSLTQELQGIQGNAINQLRALMPLIERWLTANVGPVKFAAKGDTIPLVRELAYALRMETGGQATVDAYTEAFSQHYAPWAEKNPHVMENLFRVPFAMRGVPARVQHGMDTLWNEGVVFALTRMLLVAQAGRRGIEFGDADVVPVVIAVWRRIQHDKTFVANVRKAFEAAGCATLMHLCALLAPVPGPDGRVHTIY